MKQLMMFMSLWGKQTALTILKGNSISYMTCYCVFDPIIFILIVLKVINTILNLNRSFLWHTCLHDVSIM